MTDLYKIATILSGFALAGLVGCMMNIRKAMMVGMGVAWLIITVLFFLSLSELNSATIVTDFIMKSGMFFVTVILVGFYLFCVMKNREFVEDGFICRVHTFVIYTKLDTKASEKIWQLAEETAPYNELGNAG